MLYDANPRYNPKTDLALLNELKVT
jgi:hypothetical protein